MQTCYVIKKIRIDENSTTIINPLNANLSRPSYYVSYTARNNQLVFDFEISEAKKFSTKEEAVSFLEQVLGNSSEFSIQQIEYL